MNPLLTPYFEPSVLWLIYVLLAVVFLKLGIWIERRRQRRLEQPLRRQLTIRRA